MKIWPLSTEFNSNNYTGIDLNNVAVIYGNFTLNKGKYISINYKDRLIKNSL